MCLPGSEGVDTKPPLGQQTGGRQPDNQQPRRTAPIFGNGRQQHCPRSYSSWYHSVVGLERMAQVPELRTEEGGPSREESERDHEARGRERRLGELRRQRRQRWRWITAQAGQEEPESEILRRRSPLRRPSDSSGTERGGRLPPTPTPSSSSSVTEQPGFEPQPSISRGFTSGQPQDNDYGSLPSSSRQPTPGSSPTSTRSSLASTEFFNRRPFQPDSDESRLPSPESTTGHQSPKSSPATRDASPDSNFVEEESDRGSSGPEGFSDEDRLQYRQINQDVNDSHAPSPCSSHSFTVAHANELSLIHI